MSTADLAVANEIFRQLGGIPKLMATIGLKYAVGFENGAQFTFSGCKTANKCIIILDYATDTYEFTLGKVNRKTGEFTYTYKIEGIYCDQLVAIFEKQTGLHPYL